MDLVKEFEKKIKEEKIRRIQMRKEKRKEGIKSRSRNI